MEFTLGSWIMLLSKMLFEGSLADIMYNQMVHTAGK